MAEQIAQALPLRKLSVLTAVAWKSAPHLVEATIIPAGLRARLLR